MQYLRVLKQKKIFIFQDFSFYEQLKFHAHLSWAWKKIFITPEPGSLAALFIHRWKFPGLIMNSGFWGWLSIESQPQNAELGRL